MTRRYYIDYLKAFGCIAIVALHVITNRLDHTLPTELNYFVLSGLLVLTRWAVPAFVMVSGCNLLGRDNEFALMKKHSIKMLIFVSIWGLIHLLADPLINLVTGNSIDKSAFALSNLFQGPAYHLWFCFMIIGLYLLVPVLTPIVKCKQHCKWLIALCLFSSFVLPVFSRISSSLPVFGTVAAHIRFPRFGIYIFYFVLGYYIDRYVDFSPLKRKLIYFITLVSLLTMIIYGFYHAITYQTHAAITEPEYFTVVIFSFGIFTFFKYNFKQGYFYPIAAALAKHSFGIYVMHSYLIIRLSWKGIHSTMCHPTIAVPLVTALVVVICFIASWLLRKIPVIGKWIV